MKLLFRLLTCALAIAPAFAQDVTGTFPQHRTTLVMGVDVSNGFVPPAPPSRVRVPPSDQVVMLFMGAGGSIPPAIQWTKDGKAIPGATTATLTIPFATGADAGTYQVTGLPFPYVTTGITLDVVPQGHVSNVSAMMQLPPGPSVQILGFVVTGNTTKNVLFRAVGPSLKAFGIPNPVAQPRIRLYDSAGKPVSFVHPAVVIDINALFQSAGAFPLNDADLAQNAYDYGPLKPGAYTLHVSDASQAGGTVLAEVYELP